ncbi:MAG TPA: alpha-galactosidase [Nocardioidaceae bacterium]|nr:alpha-galactosidase [Nocardioidaceae bacterium]
MTGHIDWFHRRAAGTSLLLAVCADQGGRTTPVLLHWGADLGELSEQDVAAYVEARTPTRPHSALDQPRWSGVLPENVAGYTGTPAVEGWRPDGGGAWTPRFTSWALETAAQAATLSAEDAEAGLAVTWTVSLDRYGVVACRTRLENTGRAPYAVNAVRNVLPVGTDALEVLDLTGRWTRERAPQRRSFDQGTWQRAGRHGRTGHDATLVMVAGTPGFGFRNGGVWGVHVAWSGDHVTHAERTAEGEAVLGGGELLAPGEVVLAPGEAYETPELLGSWSDAGLDGMSERLHGWLRERSPRTRGPRPVVVNTWEAVYFDQDLDRLRHLADRAAEVGAERFVLDDGWFRGRRHDHAGLGDWTVDPGVWPDGLHPLVEHVTGLGMEFGLWVEPEMLNVDSDLVREHPEWVLRGRAGLPDEWRHQQVLDLQHPEAFDHVHGALDALLREYPISFVKWDHNRDLVDTAHDGRHAVHGQTIAFYRLLDLLRADHAEVEIESCASGGGRVDAGVLQRTDRIWPSDTIDALERQHIQRWTGLLVPPEIMGAHVGAPGAHTTGRRHRLSFRAATALVGHFGIEWDLTRASDEECRDLAEWVALYKRLRALVGSGRLVRGDHPDPALLVTGVVSPDRDAAFFVLATVATTRTQTPVPVRLPGLDPTRRYDVRRVGPTGEGPLTDFATSALEGEGLTLPGALLVEAGVRLPALAPESAWVLEARAL